MESELRIRKALELAQDTKVFEMGEGFLSRVPAVFTAQFPGRMAMVVSDVKTWRVAGAEVYQRLLEAGVETGVFLIPDREFHAEWKYVEQVDALLDAEPEAVLVSVGSGVINDLCKLSSHRHGPSRDEIGQRNRHAPPPLRQLVRETRVLAGAGEDVCHGDTGPLRPNCYPRHHQLAKVPAVDSHAERRDGDHLAA